MEGSFALDVLRIDVGAVLQQELAQFHALDAVDEAGAAVVVGSLDVSIVRHKQFNNVKVSHEAGRTNWCGASV